MYNIHCIIKIYNNIIERMQKKEEEDAFQNDVE